MYRTITHTLVRDRDEVLVGFSSETLALVDLESYPAFVGREADYFDMMAHLSNQMQALTAIAWKAPNKALNFIVRLAESDREFEQTHVNRIMIASGSVRSFGQLCLTTHERLFDSARNRSHALLSKGRLPKLSSPQLLNVPPGVYSVYIYYQGTLSPNGREINKAGTEARADYTVLLRHYPFPPKRVAPVRLSGLVSVANKDFLGPAPESVITSHSKWERYSLEPTASKATRRDGAWD